MSGSVIGGLLRAVRRTMSRKLGGRLGEGGVVCRVGVGDVLYVGAGYVEEGRVVSDRVR